MSDFLAAAYTFWSYEPCNLAWATPLDLNSLFIRDVSVLGCASAGSLAVNVCDLRKFTCIGFCWINFYRRSLLGTPLYAGERVLSGTKTILSKPFAAHS